MCLTICIFVILFLVMPILSTFPEKYKTAKEGEDVRFKCTLTKGNPKPRLFWRKKQNELLSGKKDKDKSCNIFMKPLFTRYGCIWRRTCDQVCPASWCWALPMCNSCQQWIYRVFGNEFYKSFGLVHMVIICSQT